MADRHFPVRPDLDQLRHQAKDLLRAIRRGDEVAIAELRAHHPEPIGPDGVKLANVQRALARSYGLPSWPRLVLACRMTDAIWRGDVEAVRELVLAHPRLLHENARGVKSNWGPPMSYAANLGQDRIVAMLHDLGATDLQHAFDRACLQGHLAIARQLYAMGARPHAESVMWTCETQNRPGLELLVELGAEVDARAAAAMILQTYCRNPAGKRQCLELLGAQGLPFPDTPPFAVHRGRIDLLEGHLRRDPGLFSRTFAHAEIYPPDLGCDADESLALHGTPLAGATLLHLTVDGDEIDLAHWMIERGADVNARAAVDADGFGGHTALFGCVVSQPYRVGLRKDDAFARLLLDRGADPDIQASLRKRLRFVADESMHEYRDVTPLSWGERFHDRDWVSQPVVELLRARRGGSR